MVVKIYISGISGNKEVKKRQQRVLMILDSKNIKYEVIDITEPGRETDKDFMQNNSKSNGGTVSDPNPRSPLPPQMFNGDEYCGDYDQFDLANEVDTLEQFLKLEIPPEVPQPENVKENAMNGDLGGEKSKEGSQEPETNETQSVGDEKKSSEKEPTPLREDEATKEGSPSGDDKNETPNEDQENETNVEKEASPERQKSVEKTESPEDVITDEVDEKEQRKESSPEKEKKEETKEEEKESINENGTVSSREQSEEKSASDQNYIIEQKKDNPSDLLIESEKVAAAE